MTDRHLADWVAGIDDRVRHGVLPASLDRGLAVVCGGLILALTGLTVLDVILRYVFNAPVSGAFELTEVMLAALIFAALPLTTDRDGHVTVEIIDTALPHRGRKVMRLIGDVVSAAVLCLFAWRLALQALRLAEDGTTTFTVGVPMAPLAWFAAAACLLSALVAILHAARTMRA